jgi:hypothetical protein
MGIRARLVGVYYSEAQQELKALAGVVMKGVRNAVMERNII